MKNYYVEGQSGWFVVGAANKRVAHSVGVSEFGRGYVRIVREATKAETDSFVAQKGEKALRG